MMDGGKGSTLPLATRSAERAAIRWHMTFAILVLTLLGGAAWAWSVNAPLDSAVVAPGQVVVEGDLKKVQHPNGGVVTSLIVREGQRVKAGELLLRLDDTETRAQLAIITNNLAAMKVRLARLRAERDLLDAPDFSQAFSPSERQADAVQVVIADEARLFASRRSMIDGQREQLCERVRQVEEEINGLREQLRSIESQTKILREDYRSLEPLRQQGLVQKQRLSALRRAVLEKEGLSGDLRARIAKALGQIAETKLQSMSIQQEFINGVMREIRDVDTRIAELREREHARRDQLEKVAVRSPRDGIVHQLSVHSEGGVIGPGETAMLIVPVQDRLMVRLRVAPDDIDLLHRGQDVRLRFSAFNQRTTPEFVGQVEGVGAELTDAGPEGSAHYGVFVAVSERELEHKSDFKLVPGMPAEAFISTGERTLANYLIKPFIDQMQHALREQ